MLTPQSCTRCEDAQRPRRPRRHHTRFAGLRDSSSRGSAVCQTLLRSASCRGIVRRRGSRLSICKDWYRLRRNASSAPTAASTCTHSHRRHVITGEKGRRKASLQEGDHLRSAGHRQDPSCVYASLTMPPPHDRRRLCPRPPGRKPSCAVSFSAAFSDGRRNRNGR